MMISYLTERSLAYQNLTRWHDLRHTATSYLAMGGVSTGEKLAARLGVGK